MTDLKQVLADRAGWADTTTLAGSLADRLGIDLDDALVLAQALGSTQVACEEAREQLGDLQSRVDSAQQLANMGDYDWHVATDTNTWSDHLYRIYGYEPQAFNATYALFLEHVFADDRETVAAAHQRAYATGEPYQMIERIVRPDGEVRVLSSNGQVVLDEAGTPVRMRGTCIDITERVRVELAREESAIRLGDAHLRQRQASEINDHVVQGLTAAGYALELGDPERCAGYLRHTLDAATRMMSDLMDLGLDPYVQPQLVRSVAADLGPATRG